MRCQPLLYVPAILLGAMVSGEAASDNNRDSCLRGQTPAIQVEGCEYYVGRLNREGQSAEAYEYLAFARALWKMGSLEEAFIKAERGLIRSSSANDILEFRQSLMFELSLSGRNSFQRLHKQAAPPLDASVRAPPIGKVDQITCGSPPLSDADAQLALGESYLSGKGAPLSFEKAADCFRKAADQENAPALYNLGYIYENGLGELAVDLDQAAIYYARANYAGHSVAQEAVERLSPPEGAKESPSAPPPEGVSDSFSPPERRVALVVGNARYRFGSALRTPLNDAEDVAQALRGFGFDVASAIDQDDTQLRSAIESFRVSSQAADAAVIYYSGHAIQIAGTNYILPVDFDARSELEAKGRALSLTDILDELSAGAKTTIVFLDACRDNPFAGRIVSNVKSRAYAVERGLARPASLSPNLFVVFSTRAGELAADGAGRNSPFTDALLRHIRAPGVEIETLMKRVSFDVEQTTNGVQEPERLSRLKNEFYFTQAVRPQSMLTPEQDIAVTP